MRLLIPVGYLADDAKVPDLQRKGRWGLWVLRV